MRPTEAKSGEYGGCSRTSRLTFSKQFLLIFQHGTKLCHVENDFIASLGILWSFFLQGSVQFYQLLSVSVASNRFSSSKYTTPILSDQIYSKAFSHTGCDVKGWPEFTHDFLCFGSTQTHVSSPVTTWCKKSFLFCLTTKISQVVFRLTTSSSICMELILFPSVSFPKRVDVRKWWVDANLMFLPIVSTFQFILYSIIVENPPSSNGSVDLYASSLLHQNYHFKTSKPSFTSFFGWNMFTISLIGNR